MMHSTEARNHYARESVATGSPAQLVLMLYERALGAIRIAEQQLSSPRCDHDVVNRELGRAQQIVTELEMALDHERGGEIATSLGSLYMYVRQILVDANVAKSAARLPEAAAIVSALRDAWVSGVIEGGPA